MIQSPDSFNDIKLAVCPKKPSFTVSSDNQGFTDIIENICFDNSEKDFVLPEDFNQLIQEEGEKIKNLNKEFMSDQLLSTSYVTNCSVTGNNNLIGFKPIKTFKWTPRLERYLLQNMKRVKPCGHVTQIN
ncbi:hypothetical protein QTP88_023924 [Uroleucon formosanum]